jgi:hypothetical protein
MHATFLPPALFLLLALGGATPAVAQDQPGDDDGIELSAGLSGVNEVDAQGATGKGAPDGAGTFAGRLTAATGRLCYVLTSSGIGTPTMAHIHSGAAGANGPVFVPFPDLTTGRHCITIDAAKAAAIAARPDDYYVNIHNADFPGGAVRGQIAAY